MLNHLKQPDNTQNNHYQNQINDPLNDQKGAFIFIPVFKHEFCEFILSIVQIKFNLFKYLRRSF